MALLIGLGNIGAEYDGTRHNIGFDVMDAIATTISASFTTGPGPFLWAEGRHRSRKITLIKPTTYMNLSGTAVKKALAKTKTQLSDTLVVYDDLNLPSGTIRLKGQGSDGGHNGIADIITQLGTREFPRLRFGIGNDFPRGKQVDFVLAPFANEELETVKQGVKQAHDACLSFVRDGLAKTMNYFN
ncbi:MAG: aminoacyl-tRNA hydrolase [Bacteroidota bacterium]